MKAHQIFISRVSFSKKQEVCHTISQGVNTPKPLLIFMEIEGIEYVVWDGLLLFFSY